MKKILLLLFIIFPIYQTMAVNYFKGTYAQALEKSRAENKPILLFFTADWCGPCQGMKSFVLTDPYIQNYLDSNYIALMLNYDLPEVKTLYARYFTDKGAVPKFLIINHREEMLKQQTGASKINYFKEFIRLEDGVEPIGRIAATPSQAGKRGNSSLSRMFYNLMLSRVKPGFRAGMNFTALPPAMKDYRTGYHFGITGQVSLTRHFYIEPGVLFTSRGGKHKATDETIRLNYVEIPLTTGIDLFPVFSGNRLRLNLTPYGAIAVAGKRKGPETDKRVDFGKNTGEISRWDYGTKAALNLEAGTFELAVGYQLGLHNLSNQTGDKMYNRGFYLTAGINLGR